MKLYKLTDQNFLTFNKTLWGENITHDLGKFTGDRKLVLCTKDVIHTYTHPLQAIFFQPIHGAIKNPILWEAEGDIIISDYTKVGVRKLTTIKQIFLPILTLEEKIEIGIRCTLKIYTAACFITWAKDWLSGKDRSKKSARTAKAAAAFYYAAADTVYAAAATYDTVYAARAAYYTKINIIPILEKIYNRDNPKEII